MTIIVSFVIYAVLGLLYCISVHAVVYRLIHIDGRLRTCTPAALHTLLSLRTTSQIRTRLSTSKKPLPPSWLRECSASFTSRRNAAAKIDELAQELGSQIGILELVANLAPTLGLLGTVLGFLAQRIDSTALGHAFGTTALGVFVSIIPMVYVATTQASRTRSQEQMDMLRQHLIQTYKAPDASRENSMADEKATSDYACSTEEPSHA